MEMRDRFTYVYDNKIWGDSSGGGSDLSLLGDMVQWLNDYIVTNGIESVLDFGCGMNGLGEHIVVPQYIGTDIVPSVVEYCNKHYPLDIRLSDGMPTIEADLLLVKDVLMHWRVSEINEFMRYVRTRYKHIVLVNSCGQVEPNPNPATDPHLYAMGLSYRFEPLSTYEPIHVMTLSKNPNDPKEVLLIKNI